MDSPSLWTFENDKSDDILSSTFLQNMCRLCANISSHVLPIFDKSDEKSSIFSKLKKYLPSISVSENDLKPKHVCLPCISKLESCISFVDMSLETDSKFEESLRNKEAYKVSVDECTIPSNNEISWTSIKQEPVFKYGANKCKNEVDITSAEFFNQLYQQKAFPQQMVNAFGAPVSLPVTPNQSSPLIQENIGHSILQNLLTQDTVPTQDVVVLVEVKCKDVMTDPVDVVPKKKVDVSRNTLLPSVKITAPVSVATNNNINQQTKIVDSNGNIRIINLSDFEGKFNHFEKIASSFITDDFVAVNKSPSSMGTFVPILKTFQSVDKPDVLNVLQLEPFSSDNSLASNENADAPEILLNSPSTTTTTTTTSSMSTSSTNPSKPIGDGFACEVCGKQFTRKSRLNAHVARHSTERPHVCDQCDQTFITKWDLTLHQRIHSGVFSCEFCGKAFPARGKLERHRRTHTGERPFPCNLCNKAFSEKRNLRNHHKIHATAIGAKSNESSSVYNQCSCFYLRIENHHPVKNTCDLCRSRNNLNVTNVANEVETEDCSTVR